MALMWAAHFRENAGDPLGAIRAAEQGLALVGPDDGPALAAQLETALASLHAQLGHHRRAAEHARAALPVLDLLEVADDAIQVRSLLAVEAMTSGDLVRADALLGEIERIRTDRPGFASEPGSPGPSWPGAARSRRGCGSIGRRWMSSTRFGSRGWPKTPGWNPGGCSARPPG